MTTTHVWPNLPYYLAAEGEDLPGNPWTVDVLGTAPAPTVL